MQPVVRLSFQTVPVLTMQNDAHDAGLARFHRGDADVLAAAYRDHFRAVEQAVGTILSGADRETVVHEVFLRLLSEPGFRETFQGGSLSAWLRTVARNRAIDFRRRFYDRERPLEASSDDPGQVIEDLEDTVDQKLFLERLLALIPDKLRPVFQARFVDGLSQREAAHALDMHRTTLAYQELLIRRKVKKALAEGRLSQDGTSRTRHTKKPLRHEIEPEQGAPEDDGNDPG